ncbi:hypothetical protein [Sphingomonas aracearum]|uniref:Major facilitator superfamily (MFS) profile domain-containing protein n=1 Tax=Sphingomonas aracearum TaxID=2283317 RepID=A0A369VSF9_9SPHN|nr:hypothetical protein [Sphingomonas aracearum]RDE04963.1 hypothetical protein DVW87_15490 [Sphingomonas aracearum]
MATIYFVVSWTPKLLSQMGFADSIGIYASLAMNVAGAIGCATFGLLTTRFAFRPLSTIAFLGMGLLVLLLGVVPARAGMLVAAACLAGLFLNASISCLYIVLAQSFPASLRATGTGIGLGAGRIGAVVGPYVAGMLFEHGFDRAATCTVLALPMLGAAVLLWAMPRDGTGAAAAG